jgi:glycosyltransferase involved in cell wall biosynthesis
MARPTLALCVPAHNEMAMLPQLFAGIRAQSVPFDEVLVYDDCSIDGTASMAEQLGATVVRGEQNIGCSAGKQRLAEHTRCDWVHFLDADDRHKPEFVERARAWMVQDHAPDVVLFNYDYRDLVTDELIGEVRFEEKALATDPIGYAIKHNINNVGLYRRDRFLTAGGFDLEADVRYNEDAAMHIRLAITGLRFAREATPSIVMYRRGGSMSRANVVKCLKAQYRVMEKTSEAVGQTHGRVIAARLWGIAGCAAAAEDWATSDSAVRLAVRLGGYRPADANLMFRLLCAVSPTWAVRTRERLIRLFKPQLRVTT